MKIWQAQSRTTLDPLHPGMNFRVYTYLPTLKSTLDFFPILTGYFFSRLKRLSCFFPLLKNAL